MINGKTLNKLARTRRQKDLQLTVELTAGSVLALCESYCKKTEQDSVPMNVIRELCIEVVKT